MRVELHVLLLLLARSCSPTFAATSSTLVHHLPEADDGGSADARVGASPPLAFGVPSTVCENCSWPDAFVTLRQAGDQSILIGSARGVGNLISRDGAQSWAPTGVEYPCGQQCVQDPATGELHGFGTGAMPPFLAPNKTQSTFSFPASRWATVDANGNVAVQLRQAPETFELGFGVR